jgi:hypothetical protein
MQFSVIILHYSLFGQPYLMSERFYRYLRESKAYKIAFFQDEYHYCQTRFRFLNDYRIDCVYTLLEPPYFSEVYDKNTCVSRIVYTLPGYVDETLILKAQQRMLPDKDRTIDVGYRARPLAWYMGAGAKEKIDIA